MRFPTVSPNAARFYLSRLQNDIGPTVRRLVLAALAATAVLAGMSAQAQPFTDFEPALSQSTQRAAVWQTGWTVFYAASLGYNAYQGSEADDGDDRYDARVSAVTSALGLGDLLLNPLPDFYDQAQRDYSSAVGDPGAQRELVLRVSQSENTPYRWQSRVLPGLVSGAAGLVIALGDDRPRDGAIQFATSMLINEVKLWTRPGAVRERLDAMAELSLNLGGKRHTVVLSGYLMPQGMGLLARF